MMNNTPTNTARTTPKKSNFFKSKKEIKNKGVMVYIGNLRYKRDENGIKFLFSRYGKVEEINIIKNPGTDTSKGYAFVNMLDAEEANNAVKGLNGAVIDGRTIKASIALERENSGPFKEIVKLDPIQEQKELEKEMKKIPAKRKKRKGLDELMTYLNR